MSVVKIDWSPTRRTLRQFGAIGVVAFCAFIALVHYRIAAFARLSPGAAQTAIRVLAGLAVYSGLCAALAPAALKWLYIGLSVVGYPIGLVVSYVILFVLFYFVMTPVGLVFKFVGRNALNLGFDPAVPTYWIRRHPPASVKRYFRQF